jgi:indolepyruvate ferredoxin oxidoreductase beta subunit
MKQNFNILITGVGGQGLITLVDVMTKAIFIDGKDVKSSELHGLSQRGGAVAVYVSMSNHTYPERAKRVERVWSPLFKKGDADLILGLELLEGLRGCAFANKNTKIIVNDEFSPLVSGGEGISRESVLAKLQEIVSENLHLVGAGKICQEKLQKGILATMYLLGYAIYNRLLDIKPESVVTAIKEAIPEKYQQINIDAFNLAKS